MNRKPLALAFLLLPACGGADPAEAAGAATLHFTAIPDQNTTELRARFDPVAAHLERTLGVPVRYVPATDYQASVEMFANGDVQLAWFGGLTGLQARARVPGARAIAQGAEDPRYYSYFIAHADTGLEKSEEFPMQIAGLRFAFGSESSTSGRMMPEHFIRKHSGKSPREFFTNEPLFSGSHDRTCELVASGQVQAGVVNYAVYDQRVAEGRTDPAVVKVIWRTPPYADYNLTAHPVLEQRFGTGFLDKLQKALIGIDDEALLRAFTRSALIPASNADFDNLGELARELGMLR